MKNKLIFSFLITLNIISFDNIIAMDKQVAIVKHCAYCNSTQNLNVCNKCNKIYYCSKRCKERDLPTHRLICNCLPFNQDCIVSGRMGIIDVNFSFEQDNISTYLNYGWSSYIDYQDRLISLKPLTREDKINRLKERICSNLTKSRNLNFYEELLLEIIKYPECLHLLNVLFDNGLNFATDNSKLGTKLIALAIERENSAIVRRLLEHGANPSVSRDLCLSRCALHLAVEQRNVDIVKIILEFRPDLVSFKDFSGRTPLVLLFMSARWQYKKIIAKIAYLLLLNGADAKAEVRSADKVETAIDLARNIGFEDLAYLMENYDLSNPTLRALCLWQVAINKESFDADSFNKLPIELQEEVNSNSIENKYLKFDMYKLKRIIEDPCAIDFLDNLINKGLDPNMPLSYLESPLYIAVEANNTKAVISLLNHGAKVVPTSRVCQSYLANAIKNDNIHIARLLLKNNKEIALEFYKGPFIYDFCGTPLIFLFKNAKLEDKKFIKKMTRLLLKNGANTTYADEKLNMTAADLARQKGFVELAMLIDSNSQQKLI